MPENTDEIPRSAFVRDFAKAWFDKTVSFAEEVEADDFRIGAISPDNKVSDSAFTVTHRGDQLHCRVAVYEQSGRCGVLFWDAGPVEAIDPPSTY